MRVFNKIGKATLATTIAAAALLSTSQLSEASGSGEGPANPQNDMMAMGNTKTLKRHLYGRRWYGPRL